MKITIIAVLFALILIASEAGAIAQLPPAGIQGQVPVVNAPVPGAFNQSVPDTFVPQEMLVRIKDITQIYGDRNNHVLGNGLVNGLQRTGGRSEQTIAMVRNYYATSNLSLQAPKTDNSSAVTVSGKIPPYARRGETILVNVAVADDATSLRGGVLLQTPLRGIDGEIYAVAQGPVIVGGVSAEGDAASVQQNHTTAGICEAIIEREISCDQIVHNGMIRLLLINKDYSTATRISNAINSIFPNIARSVDSGTVDVLIPRTFMGSVPEFISMIGDRRVRPDQRARVVINQKTGTVVIGQEVRITRVLFANESIVISTAEAPVAAQPAPLSQGQTAVLPRTSIDIVASGGNYNILDDGITVGDLARALNTLAVSPSTLISVFQSLHSQGALQAELIIE
ncbi:MAG: flagellar basal body P-ring protein FlgI [Planctomycetota bacterium]